MRRRAAARCRESPLPTPGGTTKRGLLFGEVEFYTAGAAGALWWHRPAAASPAVSLFPQGWPDGIVVQAEAAFFTPAMTMQTALGGITAPGQGNALLLLHGGGLTQDIFKTSFSITGNSVVKVAPMDSAYTLTLSPSTGMFSGTFTPNWAAPSATKPAFKGMVLQKEGSSTGHGFFLNNAKNEPAPGSGSVFLEKNNP